MQIPSEEVQIETAKRKVRNLELAAEAQSLLNEGLREIEEATNEVLNSLDDR